MEEQRLWKAHLDADDREQDEPPLYGFVVDAIDLTGPELWKSNSFAALRARLIIAIEQDVAALEWDIGHRFTRYKVEPDAEETQRLARAREILRILISAG